MEAPGSPLRSRECYEARRVRALEESRKRSQRMAREYRQRRKGSPKTESSSSSGGGFAFGSYTKKKRCNNNNNNNNNVRRGTTKSGTSCPPKSYVELLRGEWRPSEVEEEKRASLKLGCRVDVVDRRGAPRRLDCGSLRFLGPTAFSTGRQAWCGVELDLPLGKHDGAVDGVRYFTCGRDRGLMVPAELCRNCEEEPAIESAKTEEVTSRGDESPRRDPKLEPYFRMVEVGVPRSAVALKMLADGIDGAALFADEKEDERKGPFQHAGFRALHWDAAEGVETTTNEPPPKMLDGHEWPLVVTAFGKRCRPLPRPIAPGGKVETTGGPPTTTTTTTTVLDPRRAMNVDIMLGKLSGLGADPRSLAEDLWSRRRKFTAEELELLAAVAPNEDERRRLGGGDLKDDDLRRRSPAEAALAALAGVPRCAELIQAELLLATYAPRLAAAVAEANLRSATCRHVCGSRSLRRFLDTSYAVASGARFGCTRRRAKVAFGSLPGLLRAKGNAGTFVDVVTRILRDRGDLEALDFCAHVLKGTVMQGAPTGVSCRGEPRELALAVTGVANALADARGLVLGAADGAAEDRGAAAAQKNAVSSSSSSTRSPKKRLSDAEVRLARARDEVRAATAAAFAALEAGNNNNNKTATPITPYDPNSWARRRRDQIERAAAIRAYRRGVVAPPEDSTPTPVHASRPPAKKWRLPERVAAAIEAGNRGIPVLRAARAWATSSAVPAPRLEVFVSSSRHALRMAATLRDLEGGKVLPTEIARAARNKKPPETKKIDPSMLLAAICRREKRKPARFEALAARSAAIAAELGGVDDALDAAEAALAAANAAGDDLRRFLASSDSADACLSSVVDVARLVALTLDRAGIVPGERHDPRVDDIVLTPFGVATVDATRESPWYPPRRVATVRLLPPAAYVLAYVDPKHLLRPPCRAFTPYGPAIVETLRRPHARVRFSWGAAFLRLADLRYCAHEGRHHYSSLPGKGAAGAAGTDKPPRTSEASVPDDNTSCGCPTTISDAATATIDDDLDAADLDAADLDAVSDLLDSDLDDDLANLGSFLEV